MIIYSPIAVFLIICFGLFLSRKQKTKIPILINGLLPFEKDGSNSNARVYIAYATNGKNEGKKIFNGYSDRSGRAEAYIPADNIGKEVIIRIIHPAYRYISKNLVIPRHGIVYTVELEKDNCYVGDEKALPFNKLKKYYKDSVAEANKDQETLIKNAYSIEVSPFARIPIYFWLIAYISLIISFAGDYLNNSLCFNVIIESFIQALYLSIITITTLGYGDISPISDLMRMLVSVQAILGIFVLGFSLNSIFYGPRK